MAETDQIPAEDPERLVKVGHRNWERLVLGENSVQGTFRLLLYIVLFVALFGTLFHFAA